MIKNSRAKGWRNQNKCINDFKDRGFDVAVVERGGKFLKEKDAFGLFDIACMDLGTTYWVQVTTNRNHPHKPYIEFSEKHQQLGTTFQQFVWYDNDNWRIFTYKNGKKTEEDRRRK